MEVRFSRPVCGGGGLKVCKSLLLLRLLASFRMLCYQSFVRHLRHALGAREEVHSRRV
jgi:hypothetical protein